MIRYILLGLVCMLGVALCCTQAEANHTETAPQDADTTSVQVTAAAATLASNVALVNKTCRVPGGCIVGIVCSATHQMFKAIIKTPSRMKDRLTGRNSVLKYPMLRPFKNS